MSMVIVSQFLLWSAVIVLTLIVIALARQIGLLHERIAPAGALTLHQQVKPGDSPVASSHRLLGGGEIIVGGERGDRSQLVFFASPKCPVCKSLFPILISSIRAEKWVDVILASDASDEALNKMVADNGLQQLPMVVSEALGRSLGVSKLPYAVLFDENGKIASMGLINSREHLESLFEAKERGVASLQDYLKSKQKEGSVNVQR